VFSNNLAPWPYYHTIMQLALALGLGLFVGLERERRRKEAGVRTFAFAALLGALGGLLGDEYALLALVMVGVLVVFLNWHEMRIQGGTELTTSAAFLLIAFVGVLCGKGHTFTPVAVAVATSALLAWKQDLAGFSVGLTEPEVRSAILLAILAFVVYPILPERSLDPWNLVEPRVAWATIILIAALAFVNYILLKLYGERGVEFTGFLGGVVNSTVATAEMASRVRETGAGLEDVAYRGVMLSTAAMIARNGFLLGVLALQTLRAALLPMGLMLAASLAFALLRRRESGTAEINTIKLESPFSLKAAIKFGLVFIALEAGGTLAQRYLGQTGFYVVSLLGGVVSSASSVASAATLAARGSVSPAVAANGAVLASLASVLVDIPLIVRICGFRRLSKKVTLATAVVTVLGLIGMFLQPVILAAAGR
jgi:uncharacterized membrane protein (DUF4010 family)